MSEFNIVEAEIGKGWNSKPTMNSQARRLWHGARRNFYYRDNPSRAALLCKQIIAQFSLTEEADEARLLLHDIRMEIRKMVGISVKPGFPEQTEKIINTLPCPGSGTTGTTAKFGLAVAAVFLPLIGVGRDGIIVIAVPGIAALIVFSALFRAGSKVRRLFR